MQNFMKIQPWVLFSIADSCFFFFLMLKVKTATLFMWFQVMAIYQFCLYYTELSFLTSWWISLQNQVRRFVCFSTHLNCPHINSFQHFTVLMSSCFMQVCSTADCQFPHIFRHTFKVMMPFHIALNEILLKLHHNQ